jgi:hypothetical protein
MLAEKYGVDKCPTIVAKYRTHTYTPEYDKILQARRSDIKSVLEIGIGTEDLMSPIITNYQPGCSLKMWRDYFPNATIFGCDIVKSVLFMDDRIKTFYVDQSDSNSLQRMRDNIFDFTEAPQIDFIIDDGSHKKIHQEITFVSLWSALAIGGIYIIEDIDPINMSYFEQLHISNNFKNCKLLVTYNGKFEADNFIAFQKVEL